eukprot:Rmarinus@m.4673
MGLFFRVLPRKHNLRLRLIFILLLFLFYSLFDLHIDDDTLQAPRRELMSAEAACDSDFDKSWGVPIWIIGTLYMFLGLALISDDYFVPSLEAISEELHLSEDVAGATFMAAGSSAPELFTSLMGVFATKDATGFGTIVGSAVFNILIIIALTAALAGQPLDLDWRPLARDSTFYSFSIAALVGVFFDGEIYIWESVILLVLYGCYVYTMVRNEDLMDYLEKKFGGHIPGRDEDSVGDSKQNSARSGRGSKIAPAPQDTSQHGGNGDAVTSASDPKPRPTSELSLRESSPTPPPDIPTRLPPRPGQPNYAFTTSHDPTDGGGTSPLLPQSKHRKGATDVKEASSQPLSPKIDGFYLKDLRGKEKFRSAARIVIRQNRAAQHWTHITLLRARHEALDSATKNGVMHFLSLPFNLAFKYTIPNCGEDGQEWAKEGRWYLATFSLSIAWIGILSFLLVDIFISKLGCIFGIDTAVMGLTVLAAGTSVPDALSSVIVARQGEGNMAVSNAIGSNVFDILLGLGFPWLLGIFSAQGSDCEANYFSHYGAFDYYEEEYSPAVMDPIFVKTDALLAPVLILFGVLILVVGLLVFFKWKLHPTFGMCLTFLYVLFVAYNLINEKSDAFRERKDYHADCSKCGFVAPLCCIAGRKDNGTVIYDIYDSGDYSAENFGDTWEWVDSTCVV